jgi:hypothetical protein
VRSTPGHDISETLSSTGSDASCQCEEPLRARRRVRACSPGLERTGPCGTTRLVGRRRVPWDGVPGGPGEHRVFPRRPFGHVVGGRSRGRSGHGRLPGPRERPRFPLGGSRSAMARPARPLPTEPHQVTPLGRRVKSA